MTGDPRIDELLAGYPDDLSDAELAELRAAAEQDPELDELMFSLLEADAELAGAPDGPTELSEAGQARMDGILDGVVTAWSTGGALPTGSASDSPQAWSTGGALPTGSVNEEPQAWSTGGALPTGSVEEGPQAQVQSLADARRLLRSNPAFLALAAGLLLAVGFMVRDVLTPPGPGFEETVHPEQGEPAQQACRPFPGGEKIDAGGLGEGRQPIFRVRRLLEEPLPQSFGE